MIESKDVVSFECGLRDRLISMFDAVDTAAAVDRSQRLAQAKEMGERVVRVRVLSDEMLQYGDIHFEGGLVSFLRSEPYPEEKHAAFHLLCEALMESYDQLPKDVAGADFAVHISYVHTGDQFGNPFEHKFHIVVVHKKGGFVTSIMRPVPRQITDRPKWEKAARRAIADLSST